MNKVGEFESIFLIECPHCKKEEINVPTLLKGEPVDFCYEPPPWQCLHCYEYSTEQVTNFGHRFICPICKEKNIQIAEPTRIDNEADCQFMSYIQKELVCFYCENTFGLEIVLENDDPSTMKKILTQGDK